MSELIRVLVLDLLFGAVGWLLLGALGFRPALARPTWLGLAFVVGWGSIGLAVSLMAMAGIPPRPLTVLCVALGLAAAGYVRRPRARDEPSRHESDPLASRIASMLGMVVVGVALAVAGARGIFRGADTNWDAWAFWLPKARSIYYFGGFDVGPAGITSYASPEYPPFLPVQHAVVFGFQGSASAILLPLQQVVLAAAFFCAFAAVLRHRVPGVVLWPSLALLATAPALSRYLVSALADPVAAYTLALAGVSAALWWLERARRWWNLTALLLAMAALQKSEGLLLGLLLGVLLVLLAGVERRCRREALTLAVVPVLTILPWKLWLATHGAPLGSPYYSWGDLLDPRFLADRADRLQYAIVEMLPLLLGPSKWLLVVPTALTAATVAIKTRPSLSVLVLGWIGLGFLGLAAVYWIGSPPLEWYVSTSASRVLLSLGMFAGAMLPLLIAEVFAASQRQPPVSPL